MGAGKWRDEYSKHLKGANVVILPDNDEPGRKHAEQVTKSLTGIAASVRTIELPSLPQAGDPYDWIQSGGTVEKLWALTEAAVNRSLIMSSREFVAGYVAPQYMIEGIIQQRRIYSLTGKTGDGKTALQLYLAYLIATATMLGEREVERGRVLYLAGENPDDVRARWIAMSDALGFDVDTVDVHFVEGVFSVSGLLDRVTQETEAVGGFAAVI